MADRPRAEPAHPSPLNRATLILGGLFIVGAAASNWSINHVGRNNGPFAPHTLPIGWGLQAPSGVALVGLMITVRDALHERIGLKGTLIVIAVGSILSAAVAPAELAVASSVTLLISEASDAAVYQRLRQHGLFAAGVASNIVSAVIDSAVFLTIAYGASVAWDRTWALSLGKFEASLVAFVLVIALFKIRRH